MSEAESINQIHSFSKAVQGGIIGAVLVFVAMVNIDLAGLQVGFIFLPTIAIFLWPRDASHSWSLICIFALGLFHDISSAGPLGVWTLCYLSLFLVVGGGLSFKVKFWSAVSRFLFYVMLAYILVTVFGRVAIGTWPNLVSLAVNAGASLCVFPLLFWGRSLFEMNEKEGMPKVIR